MAQSCGLFVTVGEASCCHRTPALMHRGHHHRASLDHWYKAAAAALVPHCHGPQAVSAQQVSFRSVS